LSELRSSTIGGRYALCGEIASGGMATVHLARQVGAAGFARIVAIKRLHERYARDPEFVAMFLDEARIVARIRHPNVVQTIDVVAEDGELFLVMEYIHGESLLRMMQMAIRARALLPVPVAAAILVGALHGLQEAHDARGETGDPLGIVHRDVSPHNVLIGTDGAARVLDFGVAKASQRIQTTLEGQLKGKLSYMAPEQITNRPTDRRTDVYSAAVVLWEALTGTKLFQGDSEGAVLNQILLDTPRPPGLLNPAVPAALDAVVMRGLAREPEERFESAREMALAIERATPLASAAQIGELVSTSCASSISGKQRLIASVEARTSSMNLRDAVDSLRSLASSASSRTSPPPHAARSAPDVDEAAASAAAARSTPPREHAPPSVGVKRDGRFAAVAFSLSLVVSVLALGGYLLLAKSGVAQTPLASASASQAVSASVSASASASEAAVTTATAAAIASPTTCPEGMALVPGGRFFMGSDDDLPAERPAHKVTLRAYCMDKLEVTTAAYRACSDRGDCKRAGTTNRWEGITPKDARAYDPLCNASSEDVSRGAHPINCVDWNMADRFCKAEGKRLPTEAEWEFAARGSDGRKYPWGDAAPSVKHLNACGAECVAWGKKHGALLEGLFTASDGWAATAPVGSFPQGSSQWGIEDLVGNVWEWVADYYDTYADADQRDPVGPTSGRTRAMRGGAWNGAYTDWVRPSFRFHDAETTRSHGVGFRCAKTL
jgi:formylglycine-generating enzyme required for sulfatase activity